MMQRLVKRNFQIAQGFRNKIILYRFTLSGAYDNKPTTFHLFCFVGLKNHLLCPSKEKLKKRSKLI